MSKKSDYKKGSDSGKSSGSGARQKQSGNFNESVKSDTVVNTAPPPPPRKPSNTKNNE